MRINHNISALNTNNQLQRNNSATSSSLAKLSSGLRINSAADDAAGLAISEKMRSQINGLDQAESNANDGISLIQTAEGALSETHSILQRMRELATQASNGTNTSEDRDAIQQEMDELTTEIDRIANTTEFNTKNLLDGSFSDSFQIGANSGQNMDLSISAMGATALGLNGGVELNRVSDAAAMDLSAGVYTISSDNNIYDSEGIVAGTISLTTGAITLADGTTALALGHEVTAGSTIKIDHEDIGGATVTLAKATTGTAVDALSPGDYKISGTNLLNGDTFVGTISTDGTLTLADGTTTVDLTELTLDGADLTDGYTFTVTGVSVSSADQASGSLDTLDAAIKQVSQQRSKLGAYQNRLEHTINNLSTSSENLTAAESQIRDVDMAEEMTEYTKNNILSQAAQADARSGKSAASERTSVITINITEGIRSTHRQKAASNGGLLLASYYSSGSMSNVVVERSSKKVYQTRET